MKIRISPTHLISHSAGEGVRSTGSSRSTAKASLVARSSASAPPIAIRLVEAHDDLVAFERGSGADAVLCAFNLGEAETPFRLPAGWRVAESVNLPGGWTGGALPVCAGLVAVKA
jgi:alpha-glucosidase